MATTIAISGKGGSGKTTIAAIIIQTLINQSTKSGSVLAIDADPNACLAMTMGTDVEGTIAQLREQAKQKKPDNTGMDKSRTFEYGIQQAVTEAKGFDLLTMGRPEGPSCYCAANNLLRQFMDKLNKSYDFVIIDNEAGMEHLSRRTTNNIDWLFIVADHTPIGEVTAKRIAALVKNLPIIVKKTGIIWNKTENHKDIDGIETFGTIPYDEALFNASTQGITVPQLDINTPAFKAVQKILEQKLNLIKI